RNLVFNAIKFTRDEGKIMLSAHVDNSSFVEISIEDNGIGMSQEILNNLFRLDCKFNRSGTAGEASTGLGLIICKDFVDKHGGRISVASIEGAGSTFTVTFPRSL
ncbi:MAG: ATP-binding protein, partial [Bacteroidales bacterium]|nr:ATP-binding protein [Bacteroidales bacterium]